MAQLILSEGIRALREQEVRWRPSGSETEPGSWGRGQRLMRHALRGLQWSDCVGRTLAMITTKETNLELVEGHAGIGDGGVVLIRNPSVVAQDLPLFRLDQS